MFKYISLEEQANMLRSENARLKAENIKLASYVDYLAMMTDIDLDNEEVLDNGEE